MFTTDPSIAANDFVVLEDPKNLFAAQNVVPLINKAKVEPHGHGRAQRGLGQARPPSHAGSTWSSRSIIDKKDARPVAKDFLTKQRLG